MTASRGLRADGPRGAAKAAGERTYISGLPCKRGHTSERMTVNGGCIECAAAKKASYDLKYSLKNSEKKRAAARQWRIDNPERAAASDKAKYAKNKEKDNARSRAYRQSNRQRIVAGKKAHYHANKTEDNARCKRWRQANPEKVKAIIRNRKARLRNAQGKHTGEDIKRIRAAQKNRCAYCKISLNIGQHVDHIYPLAGGGANDRRNLQLTCGPCNLLKRAKHPIDFAREIGLLI